MAQARRRAEVMLWFCNSPWIEPSFGMLELEEAVGRILAALPSVARETIGLAAASGRILMEPLESPSDVPPFDNSAMDGYAVRAEDLRTATAEAPVGLQLCGRVAAGEMFAGKVPPGGCVRIFTGSPLPAGSDAVVMQEDTRIESGRPDRVLVGDRTKPWENVRFKGQDIKRGGLLAESGSALTAGRLSLLAACGVSEVVVGKQPRVALMATGSELLEAGQPLSPGKIYESNRIGLAALLGQINVDPLIVPLVTDSGEAVRAALESALSQCDVVVTSGGVSVGEMDFVKSAFEAAGGVLQFWRVAIKPGRPFVFGRFEDKFLFGLPGNPVSALVTFLLLVRPALLRWQGARKTALPAHPGMLVEPFENPGQRRHFVRVKVSVSGEISSAGLQASHVLSSLAAADGLLDMPAGASWEAGKKVQVLRFGGG